MKGLFKNREETGAVLSRLLKRYTLRSRTIVLGLPRGGVVVAARIASMLQLPLDVVVTRKIGAPGDPEYAVGAIDEDGNGIFDEVALKTNSISSDYLEQAVQREKREIRKRLNLYRKNRPPLDLVEKTVIIVDDGIATGFTMRAAILFVKKKGAKRVVVAVPLASSATVRALKKEVKEVICPLLPDSLYAISMWYEEFPEISHAEVVDMLAKNARYEFVEHPSDITVRAYGASREEVFIQSARAMMVFIFGEEILVKEPTCFEEIRVVARDASSLFVAWLSELLFRVTTNYQAYVCFEIRICTDMELRAKIGVCKATAQDDIKAVTYHNLLLQNNHGAWEARVTFDI